MSIEVARSQGYGFRVERLGGRASVIGDVEISGSGNVVLRVGHMLGTGKAWEQTEHVVLTEQEFEEFVAETRERLAASARRRATEAIIAARDGARS